MKMSAGYTNIVWVLYMHKDPPWNSSGEMQRPKPNIR